MVSFLALKHLNKPDGLFLSIVKAGVINYLETCLTLFGFYLKFAFYALKNGYIFLSFFYFLGAMSRFFFLPLSDFFADIGRSFVDKAGMEIITKDFLNE